MHWCSSHLTLQSHPHQTSLITFTFVLRFCADYLGSFLQETEDKPLAVQLRKFPLYTFLKITNMQAPTTRGANSLVLPCERGIQPGFPRAGEGVGAAELPLPLFSSMVLFQWVWHLWQPGLFCWFGTERQMKRHNLPGRLLLPQAWMKLWQERLDSLFKGRHWVWPVKLVTVLLYGA